MLAAGTGIAIPLYRFRKGGSSHQSIDRKDAAMSGEDFRFLARLRRRSRFENPVTEPKRTKNQKDRRRPILTHRYSFYGNALTRHKSKSLPRGLTLSKCAVTLAN